MKWLKRIGAGIAVFLAFVILAVLIFFRAVTASDPAAPDLILYNGTIITMDTGLPSAEAVAVSGGRIRAVGTLNEVARTVTPGALRIDLKGKTLIPGFNDNHTHTFGAGVFYEKPLLWGKSCNEIAGIVAAEAKKHKPGELIQGNVWDYDTCPNPHRAMLDAAAPHNPVFLVQYSGHAAWVNSSQLEKMGITRDTPDPKGGQIVRDGKGEPTGILRDTAMGSFGADRYAEILLNQDRLKTVIGRMLVNYRRYGITSVQDNTWEPLTQRMLVKLLGEGRLSARFTCWPSGDAPLVRHILAVAPVHDGWVSRGPVKHFADGAFSTRTAWLTEPYADEPGNSGRPRYSDEEMREIVMEAARDRRQIVFHAIGDAAVKQFLDAVETAQAKYPWTAALRFRLEHVQIVRDDDIPRMKRLGVVASVQPFALCNPKKDVTLLGAARAKHAYPYRSLAAAGVPVAFGSDVPAEVDFNPLLGIYYAVTRKSKTGNAGPLNAAECMTPREALYCYTMGSAYAGFAEKEKGSITPGKLADMTVLSDDPTRVDPVRLKDIRVLMTIVGGKIMFRNRQ